MTLNTNFIISKKFMHRSKCIHLILFVLHIRNCFQNNNKITLTVKTIGGVKFTSRCFIQEFKVIKIVLFPIRGIIHANDVIPRIFFRKIRDPKNSTH